MGARDFGERVRWCDEMGDATLLWGELGEGKDGADVARREESNGRVVFVMKVDPFGVRMYEGGSLGVMGGRKAYLILLWISNLKLLYLSFSFFLSSLFLIEISTESPYFLFII